MKPIEERAKHDDFELDEHYDFSEGVRGRFYASKKVPTTMRIDNDVLIYLKKYAAEQHIAYQTLINTLLRKSIERGLKP
ncbi:BrnA antitoxin family protein [sulfur-oxidizing endosymbiont of Gigantopelta aegis]|uniref:BrnA antitoxin family protein n=1 Tax=sulfur-oxidizing endosymbiont of Gigantopelta aegis TaxID=2794934 RepID=UPI0018DB9B5B|nr:BrnA antitoxin family protein [sulfur-oxidizing endosymbiont of Gigantopelta aegis]